MLQLPWKLINWHKTNILENCISWALCLLILVAVILILKYHYCHKTKDMQLVHALGTLNPCGINECFTLSVNLLLYRNLFLLRTIFFLFFSSHISILLFPFVFYIPISLHYFSLRTSLYKHLFIHLSCNHSDKGLQSQTSVLKFFFTTV